MLQSQNALVLDLTGGTPHFRKPPPIYIHTYILYITLHYIKLH